MTILPKCHPNMIIRKITEELHENPWVIQYIMNGTNQDYISNSTIMWKSSKEGSFPESPFSKRQRHIHCSSTPFRALSINLLASECVDFSSESWTILCKSSYGNLTRLDLVTIMYHFEHGISQLHVFTLLYRHAEEYDELICEADLPIMTESRKSHFKSWNLILEISLAAQLIKTLFWNMAYKTRNKMFSEHIPIHLPCYIKNLY